MTLTKSNSTTTIIKFVQIIQICFDNNFFYILTRKTNCTPRYKRQKQERITWIKTTAAQELKASSTIPEERSSHLTEQGN